MAVLKELGLGGTGAWRVRRRAYMVPVARRWRDRRFLLASSWTHTAPLLALLGSAPGAGRPAADLSLFVPYAHKGPERSRAWVVCDKE